MKKRILTQICAAVSAAALSLCAMPVHAAEKPLRFRVQPERYYVLASELKSGDVVLHSHVYIENYTDMTDLVVSLKCDAPLSLENGAFVENPSYFEKNSMQTFRQKDINGKVINRAVWYGPEDADYRHEKGIVANPNAPLLQFDLRIPQDTAVGSYAAGFDTDSDDETGSGVLTPHCRLLNDLLVLTPVYVSAVLTVEPTYQAGDVDDDKKLSLDDALSVLQYYTAKDLLHNVEEDHLERYFSAKYVHSAREAADYDGSGAVDMDDALAIMHAYTGSLLNK